MKFLKISILVILWAHLFDNVFVSSYPDAEKYHLMISSESNYFPTIQELIKRLDLKNNSGKKFVIIGGSSMSAGIGQRYENIWSNVLAQSLGSDYKVINSAMNGGTNYEFGFLQAKYLAEHGEKVVYVFDGPPNGLHKGNGRWAYIYLNACLKGYERDLKGCINNAHYMLWKKGNKADFMKYIVDAVIPNQNLWNYVSYHLFQFQYHRHLNLSMAFSSRKAYGVVERNQYDAHDNGWQERQTDAAIKREVEIVRGYTAGSCFEQNGECDIVEIKRQVARSFSDFPLVLKGKTINTLPQFNPYFVNQISPNERRLHDQAWAMAAKERSHYGIVGLIEKSSDLTEGDFYDRAHWSDSGAKKHAAHVESEIKKLGF